MDDAAQHTLFESVIVAISAERFLHFIDDYLTAHANPVTGLPWIPASGDADAEALHEEATTNPGLGTASSSTSRATSSDVTYTPRHYHVFCAYGAFYESRIRTILRGAKLPSGATLSEEQFVTMCVQCADSGGGADEGALDGVAKLNVRGASPPTAEPADHVVNGDRATTQQVCRTLLDLMSGIGEFTVFAEMMRARQQALLDEANANEDEDAEPEWA